LMVYFKHNTESLRDVMDESSAFLFKICCLKRYNGARKCEDRLRSPIKNGGHYMCASHSNIQINLHFVH